jgi:hypothetical protein
MGAEPVALSPHLDPIFPGALSSQGLARPSSVWLVFSMLRGPRPGGDVEDRAILVKV